MAEEILIRINLQSGEAKSKIDGVKKSTSRLAQEKKKLIELQKAEAIEIAKLIEQQKIQRELNTKLAQSELGVGQAVNSTTAALKTGRAQSGLNNAILLETSRLASDASFGFTAIANNLSQVINLFVSFARTNGGVIASIKELSRSFLGTGGLLIVVQLLISFGPKLFKFFKDLISGADEANEKIKELTKSFDDQIRIVRILSGQVTGRFLKTFDDLKDTVTILASEFPKFAQALKNLSEQGLENNEKRLRQLVSDFTKISEIQASIAILEDSLIKQSEKGIVAVGDKAEKRRAQEDELRRLKLLLIELEEQFGKVGKKTNDDFIKFRKGQLDFDTEIAKSRQRALKGFLSEEETKVREAQTTLGLLARQKVEEFKIKEKERLDTFKSKDRTLAEQRAADKEYNQSIIDAEKSLAEFIIQLNEETDAKILQIDLKRRQRNLSIISETELNLAKLADRATGLPVEFQTAEDETVKKTLQSQIGLQERLIKTFKSGTQQRLEAEQELSRLLIELDTVTTLEREKKFKGFMKTFEDGYNAINGFSEAFSRIELNRVEAEYAQKIQAAANNTQAQAALQQELENKRDKIARRQFKIQKAANIAKGLMDTYNTGIRAYGSQLIIGDPSSPIRAQIAQAFAIAQGLANVAVIAAQKYQGTAGAGGTGTGTGGGREITAEAPDFNVVGASQVSQLAQSVSGQVTKPVKAFVVGKEITSQQELDRNINNTAGI